MSAFQNQNNIIFAALFAQQARQLQASEHEIESLKRELEEYKERLKTEKTKFRNLKRNIHDCDAGYSLTTRTSTPHVTDNTDVAQSPPPSKKYKMGPVIQHSLVKDAAYSIEIETVSRGSTDHIHPTELNHQLSSNTSTEKYLPRARTHFSPNLKEIAPSVNEHSVKEGTASEDFRKGQILFDHSGRTEFDGSKVKGTFQMDQVAEIDFNATNLVNKRQKEWEKCKERVRSEKDKIRRTLKRTGPTLTRATIYWSTRQSGPQPTTLVPQTPPRSSCGDSMNYTRQLHLRYAGGLRTPRGMLRMV